MDPIPDEIRQFLAANFDALEQLEALRVLGEDSGREWSSEEIAGQIQATPAMSLVHIAALEGRGLLVCERREGRTFCRFGAKTPELEQQLRTVLDLYRQRPVTMIRLVYPGANQALRDFSEAFKLRKEK